jgi:predicted O-linked N-acetylglucosamine transferase (SPINDLY family)/MoaA/NifB/PqqE/SkfB family radical SAM enzyme
MRNLFALPAPVNRLQIEVTTGCNLRCAGCQRTIGLEANTWRSVQMPRERFEAVLRHAPAARMLVLQGIGEPTLHPDIDAFVAFAHGLGKYRVISFNTNALVRELPFYETLRGVGLGHVSVSVDSLVPATAQALRAGTDVGKLREAVAGLARLFPNLTVSIVLSRRNLGELASLLDAVAALGARVIEVQPLIGYGDGPQAAVNAWCLDARDSAQARALLAQARARLPGVTVLGAPALEPDGSRCRRPFHAVYVTVDGLLTPCCTTNDVEAFGRTSLVEHDWADAWQQPGVVRWLNGFIDREPSMCQGCAFNPSGAGVRRPPVAQGIRLQLQGRHREAEQVFESAATDPDAVEALHRLGLAALQRADAARALPLLQAARQLAPDPRIAHNAAVALSKLQRGDEAIALTRQVLRGHPGYLPAYGLLAGLLSDAGDRQGAVDALAALAERALKARDDAMLERALQGIAESPVLPTRLTLLSNLLRVGGHAESAQRLLALQLARDPDDLEAGLTQAMTLLPIVYRSEDEIAARRAVYAEALTRMAALVRDATPQRLAAAAGVVGKAKPFFLAYQGRDDRALQHVYGTAIARIAAATGLAAAYRRPPAPGARIRVGFATRYFHMHSVSKLFGGWIEHLDRSRFEVIGYHLGTFQDAMLARIGAACDRFETGERSAAAWCQRIAADAPHVLVYPELGMDDLAIQLACHRLAPVQCVTWGHPVTTGLPHVDYFLSSALMEPPDAQAHYTETLVRLPNLSIAYAALPSEGGQLTRAALGLRASATVYVCCQSLFKYLPRYDSAFVSIAQQVPDAQFLFIGDPALPATVVFKDRVFAAFRAAGLDPARHLAIVPPVPFERFPSFLRTGDVYLDSIGWSGGNTTLEALACDLPVVTLPTGLMRGRHTAAILQRIGLGDAVAASLDDYCARAVALAIPALRDAFRARIHEGRAALYGDLTAVRALEQFFEEAITCVYVRDVVGDGDARRLAPSGPARVAGPVPSRAAAGGGARVVTASPLRRE